jgi:TraX protein
VKKMNAFQLKVIALIVMLMDHMYTAFPNIFPQWFHALSRFVAPLFAFLMVEGLFHTRNKLKYNIRLFVWAIVMHVGNIIINNAFVLKSVSVHNNIFMTLALGLTIINLFELNKNSQGNKKWAYLGLAIAIIPLSKFVEGGIIMIPFILITYFFKGHKKKVIIGYSVLFTLLFFMEYTTYETLEKTINMLMVRCNFLCISVIPFILLYNGERGVKNKFSKYLFYVFYPLHLWGLAILKFAL